jgi:hypothetical protein
VLIRPVKSEIPDKIALELLAAHARKHGKERMT